MLTVGARWLRAVIAADESGDRAPLITLLIDQNMPLTHGAAKLLADFVRRHQVADSNFWIVSLLSGETIDRRAFADVIRAARKKPGRPRRPIYRRSLAELKVAAAANAVRKVSKHFDISIDDAIDVVAPVWKLHPTTIWNAVNSARPSARKHQARQGFNFSQVTD